MKSQALIFTGLLLIILTGCKQDMVEEMSKQDIESFKLTCLDSFKTTINGSQYDFNTAGQIHNDILDAFPEDETVSYSTCQEVIDFRTEVNSAILAAHSDLSYTDTSFFNDCNFLQETAQFYDQKESDLLDSIYVLVDETNDSLINYNYITSDEAVFLDSLMNSLGSSDNSLDFCALKNEWESLTKTSRTNGLFSGMVLSIAYHSTSYWENQGYGKTNWLTVLGISDAAGAYVAGMKYIIEHGPDGNSSDFGEELLYGAATGSLLRWALP